jgi:hypothetical protein
MLRTFILAPILASALTGAVVIDRVAAIVGKHAIKSSDIQRDLRLTQFMNREPVNLSSGEMRKAAERLIDQTLIRDEIVKGGYRRPADAEANSLLSKLVRDRFGGSDVRLRQDLSRYGITEDELREELLWQLTVLRFIGQRFQPAIQVTDDDLKTYYERHLAALKHDYPRSNSLEALQTQIRVSIEGERTNQAFTTWLENARKGVRIEYREGAFQ